MNLAVVAGAAVTTAVVTGALLVGDSLRESLRAISLDRLGTIEQALVNDRFFDSDLGERIAPSTDGAPRSARIVPSILLSGSMQSPSTGRRASGIQLLGIDDHFIELFPDFGSEGELDLDRQQGQIFPSVVINSALQGELDVEVGDDVLISFGRTSDIPSVSLLGRREESELLDTLRLTVTEVIPTRGPGRFGLKPRQSQPLNAFVALDIVQRKLGREGQVNTLLLPTTTQPLPTADMERRLAQVMELRDLGIDIRAAEHHLRIESRELVIRPEIVDAISSLAERHDATSWPVLTYLANTIETDRASLPYSTVSAVSLPPPSQLEGFQFQHSAASQTVASEEILLNSWAAADLGVGPGDEIRLSYFVIGADDELSTDSHTFAVANVVEQAGLAADPTLTPDLPGVSGVDDMASWDPPFPVDLDRIRPEDELYWDEFGATPKAFIDFETGRRLWRSRYGEITSLRLFPPAGNDPNTLHQILSRQLPTVLGGSGGGYRWLPLRRQGLEAASGTSDFSGLFAGFSLFLIVAAILLVVLLFTLLVEQRAREAGLLLALGFLPRQLRRRLTLEGGVLAGLGSLVGAALAVLYATLVLRGLEIWWAPLIEESFLDLHVLPASLATGVGISVLLVIIAVGRASRRVSRVPARRLLAGEVTFARSAQRQTRWPKRILVVCSIAAIGLFSAWFLSGEEASPALFFGIGATLVAAGVAGFSLWCRRAPRQETRFYRASVLQLAARNSARHPGRSLLSVALVASAAFVLVSVTANRKQPLTENLALDSGTGGLTLVAESDLPLPVRLSTYLERRNPALGSSGLGDVETGSQIYSLRLLPGEDASCLNLYQPERPRVLGLPEDFIGRGAFRFRSTVEEVENPWSLLHMELEDGVIPAIGDYNSVQWILHLALGQDLVMEDDRGDEVRLRIVGLLETSIFQSELLISEDQFIRHFPDQSGYAFFLAALPPADLGAAIEHLEESLAPFGLDAGSAIDRLANFQEVENMYLTTFEALGGLGMILGTLGLGVVLLRNVVERRGELATLRAFGYRRRRLVDMVVAENVFLLAIGLGIGTIAGLIAVAPHLVSGQIRVPWGSLATVLTSVFAVGLLASIGGVLGSLRVPLLPALKAD